MGKKKEKPAHSEIGASSMERWAECPGSVRLGKDIPSQTSGYAEEGTLAHTYASEWLMGKELPSDIDEEMMDAIAVYVHHIQNRWASLRPHKDSKLLIEHRFDLSQLYPGLYGTADAVTYCGETKTLYVDDYKHGKGIPVDPEKNMQLMYYGLGALITLLLPVDKIVLTVIQPRYSSDIKKAIKSWECDPLEMMDFIDDLKRAAMRTAEPDAPLVIGDHCQFCKARAICPALKEAAKIAVREDFSLNKLSDLDPLVISDLLSKLDQVEFWCKGVREFAYLEAKAGRVPPGYKLVSKIARRKWADPLTAQQTMERSIASSVLRECFTDPELKSPAQVEKILGKVNKPLIDSLTIAVSSGETLVKESDKREAVAKVRALEMFGQNQKEETYE